MDSGVIDMATALVRQAASLPVHAIDADPGVRMADEKCRLAACTTSGEESRLAARTTVAQLAREVKRIEVAGRVQPDQLGRRSAVFSSGCTAIDDCLPSGGYESGTIVEYLQSSAGSGATTLALTAAREALAVTDRFCVVIDWRKQFYPPAAAAMGLDLKRIIIVRPTTLADRLWAVDQALRSPAIAAVIAEIEQLDDRAARRLQLAAESGGGLGLLVRNIRQRHQPSWAEIQWLVRPVVQTSSQSSRPIARALACPTHLNTANSNRIVAPVRPLPASPHAPIAQSPHMQATTPSAPIHRALQLELLRVRGGHSGSRVHIQVNAVNGRLEPATAAAVALARKLARADLAPAHSKARRA
jgi:hypothetical protein